MNRSRVGIFVMLMLGQSLWLEGASTPSAFIAFDALGRVVAGKSVFNGVDTDFAVTRYNTDGTLDLTFNPTGPTPGLATTDIAGFNDGAESVVIDSAQNIITGGFSNNEVYNSMTLVGYTSEGVQDVPFGNLTPTQPGVTVVNLGNTAQINGLAIDSQGRLVSAGYFSSGAVDSPAVARYTPEGILDITFNPSGTTPGVVTTALGSLGSGQLQAVTLDSQGRIVVAGFTQNAVTNTLSTSDTTVALLVARYTSAGALDITFNPTGAVPGVVATVLTGFQAQAFSVIIDSQERIVVAGVANDGTTQNVVLGRYLTTGNLDSTFNANLVITASTPAGIILTPIPVIGPQDSVKDGLAIDEAGNILVAAYTQQVNTTSLSTAPPVNSITLYRYSSTGALDTTFNGIGFVTTTITNLTVQDGSTQSVMPDLSASVLIDANGNLLVGGFANSSLINNNLTLARYLPSGVLDASFDAAGVQPGVVFVNLFTGASPVPAPAGSPYVPTAADRAAVAALIEQNIYQEASQTLTQVPPSIIAPVSGLVTNSARLHFSGIAPARANLELMINGQFFARLRANAQGQWTYNTPDLSDGTYTATVVVMNSAGKAAQVSEPVLFQIDTQAPAAPTINQPPPGHTQDSSTLRITGSAEPDTLINVFLNRQWVTRVITGPNGTWLTVITALPDGTYAVRAQARDSAGNVSKLSDPVSITIDTQPLAAPVIVSPRLRAVTGQELLRATGRAKSGVLVDIYLNGKRIGQTVANRRGDWRYIFSDAMAEGVYTLSAVARTAKGLRSPMSLRTVFTVSSWAQEGGGPRITIRGKQMRVEGHAAPGTRVVLLVDDVPLTERLTNPSGSWRLDGQAAKGDHTLTVQMADPAGTVHSISRTISLI